MKIQINSILIRPGRHRTEMHDLVDLAESLQEKGQITPICVTKPTEADKVLPEYRGQDWVLVAGGRRTAAAILAGWDEIAAFEREELSPYMREALELEENIKRENLTWHEELAAKARLHELYVKEKGEQGEDQSIRQTARDIGIDHGGLVKDLKLFDMMQADPELKAAPNKKAAMRKAEFKKQVQQRIASVSMVSVPDLRRRIVTADMRDYVRQFKPMSVDLFFCDFPFGINYWDGQTEKHEEEYTDTPEHVRDLIVDIVPHMARAVKPTGWIVCMMGYTNHHYLMGRFHCACRIHAEYTDMEYEMESGFFRRTSDRCAGWTPGGVDCIFLNVEDLPWIWYRPNSRNPSKHPDLHAQNQFETIVVVNGGYARLMKPGGNVLAVDGIYGTERIHEMQRPPKLCEEIIERTTVVGELVVDLCYGSGQSLASAAKLGRQFQGCDLNPNNLDKALMLAAEHYRPVATLPKPAVSQEMMQEIETVATQVSDD